MRLLPGIRELFIFTGRTSMSQDLTFDFLAWRKNSINLTHALCPTRLQILLCIKPHPSFAIPLRVCGSHARDRAWAKALRRSARTVALLTVTAALGLTSARGFESKIAVSILSILARKDRRSIKHEREKERATYITFQVFVRIMQIYYSLIENIGLKITYCSKIKKKK